MSANGLQSRRAPCVWQVLNTMLIQLNYYHGPNKIVVVNIWWHFLRAQSSSESVAQLTWSSPVACDCPHLRGEKTEVKEVK